MLLFAVVVRAREKLLAKSLLSLFSELPFAQALRLSHAHTANYSLDWISFRAQKKPPVFNFCVLGGR
jgi:hypothetical protein